MIVCLCLMDRSYGKADFPSELKTSYSVSTFNILVAKNSSSRYTINEMLSFPEAQGKMV